MSTTTAKRTAPLVYTHSSRAEWGRAVISEVLVDRKTYVFEHVGQRTFLNGSPVIVEMDLAPEERSALAATLIRVTGAVPAPKKKKAKSLVKAAAPAAITFDRQLALFATAFPLGFVDPGLARAASSAKPKSEDAATRFAREVLAAAPIEAALRKGGASDVLANAMQVLNNARALSLPKADVTAFEHLPTDSHEAVARALADLLHGDGDYTARFDAFVHAAKDVPWTIATVFPALVHPERHFFVKPTMNQRQARAIAAAEPPLGMPTGAGYAKHLAVALATRDRLSAAGLAPRHLLDVYTFGWRTLTRATGAGPAAARA